MSGSNIFLIKITFVSNSIIYPYDIQECTRSIGKSSPFSACTIYPVCNGGGDGSAWSLL